MPEPLDRTEIDRRLQRIEGWSLKDGKLHRAYKFATFVEAFAFLTRVAFLAESLNHHPELCNVYNRVVLDLMTHDVGGVSELDFQFAERLAGL
ncbi:MAG: 4a-hydroxytetrahydrobiopterin dehydratase [Truepera sp.]|nr:4a-hydroxytetrahydrobiopterin dehydratase [Truepera sp.]